MRIGIDLQCVPQDTRGVTGVSHYALMLKKYLQRLNTEHELIFFDRRERQVPFWDVHVSDAKLFAKAKLDLLHGPAFSTPLFYRGRTVVTVHDLAIYKHPEWFPGGQWLSTKVVVPRSIKRASKIITISQSTKRDIIDIFRVGEDKIEVIPLGVEERFFSRQHTVDSSQERSTRPRLVARSDSETRRAVYGLRSTDYILCVATLEPRKNIVRLIQAYKQLPQPLMDKYDLVLAGGKGWKYQAIDAELRSTDSGLRSKIKLLGAVEPDVLPSLYQNASLFVFPTLYEGFGLPVLEAMAAGTPVLSSDLSSIPEFASGSAVLVNPYSTEAISLGMAKILQDNSLAKQLAIKGLVTAQSYTWDRTARKTLAAYDSVISD